MGSLNFMLSWVEHEKKFYNLGAWCLSQDFSLIISVSGPQFLFCIHAAKAH